MAKYLDLAGTTYLWSKICAKIESETSSLYETVNLTVTDPVGGGVSTTVTVTYNNTTNTYSYNSSTITFKVHKDVEYTITIADNDNYRTPNHYTRTSIGSNSIDITISYLEPLPDNGVYIYGTDGEFYTTDNWNQGSNATGVAIITDTVRLIVAPKEWLCPGDVTWNGNKYSAWGGYNKTISGIKTTNSSSDAITDFAGSSNTDQIISQLKGTTDDYSSYYTGAPAAEYCRAYSSGCKGVGEWYLPSVGEMNVLVTNKDTINMALTKISGKALGLNLYVWTSTQYSSWYAWRYNWSNEIFDNIGKASGNTVRPVCQL